MRSHFRHCALLGPLRDMLRVHGRDRLFFTHIHVREGRTDVDSVHKQVGARCNCDHTVMHDTRLQRTSHIQTIRVCVRARQVGAVGGGREQWQVVSVSTTALPTVVLKNFLFFRSGGGGGGRKGVTWEPLVSVDFEQHGVSPPGHWHLNRNPQGDIMQVWRQHAPHFTHPCTCVHMRLTVTHTPPCSTGAPPCNPYFTATTCSVRCGG